MRVTYKIDENIPLEVVTLLRSRNIIVETVFQKDMKVYSDTELLEICVAETAVLVTLDMGFLGDAQDLPQGCPGVIVLHPKNMDKKRIIDLLVRVCPLLDRNELQGRLYLVENDSMRITT